MASTKMTHLSASSPKLTDVSPIYSDFHFSSQKNLLSPYPEKTHQLHRSYSQPNLETTESSSSILIIPPGHIRKPFLAWIVVLASFSIILLSEGMSFSFGILLIEVAEEMKDSQSKIAFIGSLIISFPLMLGPLASYLNDSFGVQNMIIWGSFISAFGFFLGYFVNSVLLLILTICISGFGLALIDVAAIVIIVLYFKKKRALATTLSLSGTGIGTILFPLLISALLKFFTWRVVFLIIGGLLMALIPYGLVLKHPSFDLEHSLPSTNHESHSKEEINILHSSLIHLPTYLSTEGLDVNKMKPQKEALSISTLMENYSNNSKSSQNLEKNKAKTPRCNRTIRIIPKERGRFLGLIPPSYLVFKGAVYNSNAILMSSLSCPNVFSSFKESEETKRGNLLKNLKELLFIFADVRILKNHFFALFCLSGFLFYVSLDTSYLFIPAIALVKGFSKRQASYLISFIGIFNTISMLGLSLLVSSPWMKPSIMFAISSILNCLVMVSIPFLQNFIAYAVASSLFGVLVSLEYVFSPLIVIEFTSLSKFTNAYGFLLFVEGVATLVGPPLAGLVYDYTNSYSIAFYAMALCFLLSGFQVIIIVLKRNK